MVLNSDQNKQIITGTGKTELLTNPEIVTEFEKIKEVVPEGEFEKYFLSIHDSIVSLCCLESIYNPFGKLTQSDISSILLDYEISKENEDNLQKTIFKKGDNSVSLVNWESEYSNDSEIFLGKGKLSDSGIQLKSGIKIGMSKGDFLKRFFQFSDSTINKIKQVSVCQDERAETFTSYLFTNDTLSMIKFGEWEE